ncbi:uncharacterized protein LOC123475811 [Daphnia magna]|uniref:uncharacterized protein LOC123475811 n=1 Tax=Daphnia magna TaxID=35525 RepID=UPI001E1BC04F|nr:uncharacterized protein LOC123475811 [Daphnia magna]
MLYDTNLARKSSRSRQATHHKQRRLTSTGEYVTTDSDNDYTQMCSEENHRGEEAQSHQQQTKNVIQCAALELLPFLISSRKKSIEAKLRLLYVRERTRKQN